MVTEHQELEARLRSIDGLIEEAEIRLGAHSVKPALMQELLELEEERERLVEKINRLRKPHGEEPLSPPR